jgi:phosphatidylserine/phosphatidylglycerophosphate/cardiolipin synthase-like enzyme
MLELLHGLPPTVLTELAALLRDYAPNWPPQNRLVRFDGLSPAVITKMQSAGWQASLLADACQLAAATSAHQLKHALQLVLSGCQSESVPTRDTAAVMQALLGSARTEVIMAGYAFHRASEILAPLHAKMKADAGFTVRIIMDIKRPYQNRTIAQDLARKAQLEFWQQSWPWQPRPTLYFDPRSLALAPEQRASMHAKFVLVDRAQALITSANFTRAALTKNIEVGLLIQEPSLCQQLGLFADSLIVQHLLPLH